MTELKNCPFCGCKAEYTGTKNESWVMCSDCAVTNEIKDWNQRTHTKEEASLIAIGRFAVEFVNDKRFPYNPISDVRIAVYKYTEEFGE